MSFWPTNNLNISINCVIEIKKWTTANFLQLNTNKMELNIFGTCHTAVRINI